MARLISYDYIRQKALADPDSGEAVVYLQDIADAPTVDAVEVVRCRDCKRCFKHTTKRNMQKMWICMRNEVDVCVRPDDFCSYGERKDSNGNG